MKKLLSMVALVVCLAVGFASIAHAKDEFGDITVYSVNKKVLQNDSIGNIYVSFKADVVNYGKRGEVYVKLAGKDADGYEIATVVFPSNIMDTKQNIEFTKVSIIPKSIYDKTKEWTVKSADKY